MASDLTLDKIVALCKRRGFVFPSAEIYGGINGVYDFGPLGAQMRNNIKNFWIKSIKSNHDVVLIDGSILGPEKVWTASGHIDNFSDPMVDCQQCKKRYRADEIDINKSCPNCGRKNWTDVRQFHMMFKTQLGALEGHSQNAYLRPETAQAIFINFKNIITSSRVKMPFGIAQIGKAFRNEITPKQFLFRMREFEQMEMEFFCKAEDSEQFFTEWLKERIAFYDSIGVDKNKLRQKEHSKEDLAHYAKMATDIEYNFPFGWKELEGIHHRSDFDLKQHIELSGKDLSVFDEESKQSYVPYVIECSVGLDRLFLTLLFDSYCEDTVEGETRTVLKLNPKISPIKAAILPLTKKQVESAQKIYNELKQNYEVTLDVSGSIGKRYRRQDEIGTPICFTYDFDSDTDNKVTVRDRDTTKQERISIDHISDYLNKILK
ncbi:glycine--tRNA ligase [Candidatus Babeliales bacterium]|nr:glycine--tRNA ligase [Candidatus Babeliales bacterium]